MIKDIECPYCGSGQDINHDDGAGYEEGVIHQQQCDKCNNVFGFETTILYNYYPVNLPCANEGDHNWKPQVTYPAWYAKMECTYCGEIRKPTPEEKAQYKIPEINNS